MLDQQIGTPTFALSAGIEEDSLLHAVFEGDAGAVLDEQFDHLLRLVIGECQDSKIDGRLLGFGFDSID